MLIIVAADEPKRGNENIALCQCMNEILIYDYTSAKRVTLMHVTFVSVCFGFEILADLSHAA